MLLASRHPAYYDLDAGVHAHIAVFAIVTGSYTAVSTCCRNKDVNRFGESSHSSPPAVTLHHTKPLCRPKWLLADRFYAIAARLAVMIAAKAQTKRATLRYCLEMTGEI